MKKMRNKRIRGIVINKKYGGFDLSPRAKLEYYKRKGIQISFYEMDYATNTKIPVDLETLKDQNESLLFIHHENVITGEYLSNDSIERDDVDLVDVVRELGKEADGQHANLKIVEIPSDVKWIIEEYDGSEWISEVHRTWS